MHNGAYSEPVILISAYIFDLAIGDPEWLPHPVRLMGWGIMKMEGLLKVGKEIFERLTGIFLVVIIVGLTYVTFYFINSYLLPGAHHSLLSLLVLSFLTSTTIATHELIKSAKRVINSLMADDIDGARRNLSHIVGRDTEGLSKEGILRATIETVAENASDGIIAPLFYFSIGGLPLAMAYKAINTLDSMVGYKDERYRDFGWASARLDDIANYIPARVTGILIVISTFIIVSLRRFMYKANSSLNRSSSLSGLDALNDLNCLNAFKIMLRDGNKHPSPNSGIPESAMAGAFGIRLGGPSTYRGVVIEKPYIGEDIQDTGIQSTDRRYLNASLYAITITRITSLFGLLMSLVILYIKGLS